MEIRTRILDEAKQQFFRYGIRNITMDDIAAALGISKRTVYEVFKNKNELVVTCLKELAVQQDKIYTEIIYNSGNVIETFALFIREGIKVMNSVNPVFVSDLKKFYPAIADTVFKDSDKKRYDMTYQLLERGIEEGIFRKDINIPIITRLFHEQINVITDEQMFPRDRFDHVEVFRNLVINFMRGISTQKGIDIIEKIIE